MRHVLSALILALPLAAMADDLQLTEQERQAVAQMQKQWQKMGHPPMTDAQVQEMVMKMRQTQLNMMGVIAGAQQGAGALSGMVPAARSQAVAPAVPSEPAVDAAGPAAVTLAQLAEEVARRAGNARVTRFEAAGEGFSHDGTPYFDPEGEILAWAADSRTGSVGYLIGQGTNRAQLRYHNVHSGMPPLVLGQLEARGNSTSFESVTGQRAAGDSAIPTANGLMMLRDHGIVVYDISGKVAPVSLPAGFTVAAMQTGDLAGTGFLLLERRADAAEAESGPKGPLGVLGAVMRKGGRDVMDAAGVGKSQDYQLFNPGTGMAVPLMVALAGKEVGQATGCVPKNRFVNQCSGWKTKEALYQPNGLKNWRHYAWAITWHATRHGPLAVVLEKGRTELNVIRLDTGGRFNAFSRRMGIAEFTAVPDGQDGLAISAGWAFKNHEIPDVATVLAGNASVAAD